MLYDSYQRKINKIVLFMRKVFRHMVKIVIVASVLFAIGVTVMFTKGMITGAPECPPEITYGEVMDFKAEAFLSNVTYEYSVPGSGVWSDEPPSAPGEYVMRAVSTTAFGSKRYSDESSFTLLKKAIEVTVNEKETVYGDMLTVNAALSEGDSIRCDNYHFESMTDSNTLVWADESAIVITDKNGLDVTDSYDISIVESSISVLPRPITVTVEDRSIVYDGLGISFESTFDGYEVNALTPLVEGDVITATFDGSLIEAGEKMITPEFCIMKNGVDITEKYDITVVEGKMTVEQRPLYISTGSAEFVYDGRPHTHLDGYTVGDTTGTEGLLSGHQIKVNKASCASVTNAGEEKQNIFGITIVDSFGNDVSKNYNYAQFWIYGTIKVIKRDITVNELKMEFTYDGKTHSLDDYEYQRLINNLADGHEIKITDKATIKNVGSVNNTFGLSIWYEGVDVTDNYNIQYKNGLGHAGVLSVNKREITVITNSNEWMYNGQSRVDGGYNSMLTADRDKETHGVGIVSGHTLHFVGTTIKDVGEVDNVISQITVKDENGNDVSENYEISCEYGRLKVTPRALTVKTNSAQKIYDGAALTASGFTLAELNDDNVVIENAVDGVEVTVMTTGHRLTVNITGSATNVSDTSDKNNTVELVSIIDETGKAVDLKNYSISYVLGTLTVDRRELTVIADSIENMYTGKEQSHPYFTVDEGVTMPENLTELIPVKADEGWLLETTGQTLTAVISGAVTNAFDGEEANGTVENIVESVSVKDSLGNDISLDNFSITYVSGSIRVIPRSLTLLAGSLEHMYTGEVQTHQYFLVDEGVKTPEELASSAYVKADEGWLLETTEQRLTAALTGAVINVFDGELEDGVVENTVNPDSIKIKDAAGNEIDLRNYDIEYVVGHIKVTKRPLTIRTDSLSGIYNGQPRTNGTVTLDVLNDNGVTSSSTAVAEGEAGALSASISVAETGHMVNVKVTGNQKSVGTSDNTFEYTITDPDNGSALIDERNYDITSVFGKLNIGKRAVSVTTSSGEKVYDGKNLFNGSFTIVETGDTEEETVNHWVNVTYNDDGTQTVDRSAYVDSVKLTDDGLEARVTLQTTGETVDILVRGKQRDTGSSNNEYDIKIADVADNSNYTVSSSLGKLKVEARKLTVTTFDAEKTYDANDLTNGEFTLIDTLTGKEYSNTDAVESGELEFGVGIESTGETLTVKIIGKIKNAGKADNLYEIYVNGKKISLGDEKANYFIITGKTGVLEVLTREITVTTYDASKTYDGRPLTNGKFTLRDTLTEEDYSYMATGESGALKYSFDLLSTGERVTVTVTGAQTDANDKPAQNTYTVEIAGKSNNSDYTVNTDKLGSLTVSKRPVTIETGSYSWVYNGQNNYWRDWTLSDSSQYGFVDGHYLEVGESTAVMDVAANVVNEFNVDKCKITSGDKDVTANYDLTVLPVGRLSVTKRSIDVYVNDVTYIYNGQKRTYGEIYVQDADGEYYKNDKNVFIGSTGDTLTATVTGQGDVKNVGIYNNLVSNAVITKGNVDTKDNYDISYHHGKISIEKREITIYVSDAEFIYDAKEHSSSLIYVKEKNDDGITYTESAKFDALKGITLKTTGEQLKATVSVKSSDPVKNAKSYANVNHVNEGDVTVTDANGVSTMSNYDIRYEPGSITILKRNIIIGTEGGKFVYDGQYHSPTLFYVLEEKNDGTYTEKITVDAAVESFRLATTGDVMSATVSGSAKYVTDYVQSYIDYSIMSGAENANANYNIVDERFGQVKINPRALHVTTGSAEGIYNGIKGPDLTCDSYTVIEFDNKGVGHDVSGGRLTTTGDVITVTTTGSRRDVGVSDNPYDVYVHDADGNAVGIENYSITKDIGTLTVTQREIVITVKDESKIFDGSPLYPLEFIIYEVLDDGTIVETDMNDALYSTGESVDDYYLSGEQTDIGESDSYLSYIFINGDFVYENDEYSNYRMTVNGGKLTVEGATNSIAYDGGDENLIMYVVNSTVGGRMYLKLKSMGDYLMNAWAEAEVYDNYSLYYPGIIAGGLDYEQMVVSPGRDNDNPVFVIPYYIAEDGAYHSSNDARAMGYLSTDPINFYTNLDTDQPISNEMKAMEKAYRDFVYGQYLEIDDETKEYMLGIIANENFSADDPYVIDKVAEYMQLYAGLTYNKNYDSALDYEDNIAVAFMETYREGVCQHYASAATLLFRTLGIPARYTVGYVVNATANDSTNVYSGNAHAWVEVYIDGIGWQYVEVTGGDESGEGGGSGSGTSDGNKISFHVAPESCRENYTGEFIQPTEIEYDEVLDKLEDMGYTYDVYIGGGRSEIGKNATYIDEFILYDRYGNTVYCKSTGFGSERFDISFGESEIFVGIKIYVKLKVQTLEFTGEVLQFNAEKYSRIDSEMFEVQYSLTINRRDVGKVTLYDLNSNVYDYLTVYSVFNKSTGEYLEPSYIEEYIIFEFTDRTMSAPQDFAPLTVIGRKITITAGSGTLRYDGDDDELRCDDYTYSGLFAGFSVEVITDGVLTREQEYVENRIIYWVIRDSDGNVIESSDTYNPMNEFNNLDIDIISGELKWIY